MAEGQWRSRKTESLATESYETIPREEERLADWNSISIY